jgi:CheY-like chemotaxis protein
MVSGAPLKILIVEDESLVAMMIEDLLADLGHDVVAVAGRLEQGMQFASQLAIDFAVVDLNLNGERTFPIAEILRFRGIPLVFATGYGVSGLSDDWRGTPVVQKPFQPHELQNAIAKALGG